MNSQGDRHIGEEGRETVPSCLKDLVSPTVDNIFRTLRKRYKNGDYFTKLGENALIAVAPSAIVEEATVELGAEFAKYAVDVSDIKEDVAPHIFDLAASCFYHMARDFDNQSVLFLGTDDSNKSDVRRLFVRQLLQLSTVAEDVQHQRILAAATFMDAIFDAFAHASTTRSKSASQVCKYVEYQYDEFWKLVGVGTIAHHLDTSHIYGAHSGKNEVYPIFHYLIAGAKPEERSQWKLGDGSTFKYLLDSPSLNGIDEDKKMFADIQKALRTLRIGFRVQKQLFQAMAAILHLGNVTFADDTLNPNNPCSVANPEALVASANLLGVDASRLEEALVYKFKVINNQRVSMFMNSEQAAAHRNLIASTIYSKLLAWLVKKMNACLCKDYGEEVVATVRVLEIPGFRKEGSNALDRLLYNMANEELHHYATIWGDERCQLYAQEGVLSFAVTTDEDRSVAVSHLLAPDAGLLNIINVESERWLAAGDSMDDSAKSLPSSISTTYDVVKHWGTEINPASTMFRVEHYRHKVNYDFAQIVALNGDILSTAATTIFTGSGPSIPPCANGFIRNLFLHDDLQNEGEPTTSIPALSETFSRIFDAMKDANPWFVLCLESGESNTGDTHDAGTLKSEVANYQLTRQVQIRVAGDYVADYSHEEFINRFHAIIFGFSNHLKDEIDFTSLCEEFAATMGWSEDTMALGLERVFLTERAWRYLHDRLRAHEQETNQRTWNPQIGEFDPSGIKSFPDNATDLDSEMDGASATEAEIRHLNEYQREKEKERLLELEKEEKRPTTGARSKWLCCTWSLTWCCFPFCLSICGRMRRKEVQMAWREKVALCIIILLMCVVLLGFIIGIPRLLCIRQKVMSIDEVRHRTAGSDHWVYGFGKAYEIKSLAKVHDNMDVDMTKFRATYGKDISNMFYPADWWNQFCSGIQTPSVIWDNMSRRPIDMALQHRNPESNYFNALRKAAKFDIGFRWEYIQEQPRLNKTWIVLYDKVYDVSTYNQESFFQLPVIDKIFQQLQGTDATAEWETSVMKPDRAYAKSVIKCMDHLFLVGIIDHRLDTGCQFSNYVLLASSMLIIAVIGIKFLVAVQFTSAPKVDPSSLTNFVICQIPCYTESAASLKKSLESLALTNYEDLRKLLFVICDGMVVGTGNSRPTPQIVLDILGVDPKTNPEPFLFQSVGEGDMQMNRAKVYSGLYTVTKRGKRHTVPFIVVVKVGKQIELVRPGNRGKRDSQLLMMRFLSRVQRGGEMEPLELELHRHMAEVIGIHPSLYEFIFMVDADTEVAPSSLSQMVHAMVHDTAVIGLCGETVLANASQSWVTRIQVYEYFISHHLTKAFESIFGAVTCLPGCFCIYRIRSPKHVPLLISSKLIDDFKENRIDTLHLKNLFHLGEDRFLTTLVMKHFPQMKTTFITHAKCKTIAPHQWKVLLSQRRRWINSTVHNLFELLFVRRLCGFLCCSMRFVVFLDLLSTLIQPAAILYIGYLIYAIVAEGTSFPVISLALIAAIYGLQVIVFVLKRQLKQVLWMLVYIMAIPLFTFYLPLYSFWHFDDFSWGNTRVVYGEDGKKRTQVADVGKFDPASIPKEKWDDYRKKRAADAFSKEERPANNIRRGNQPVYRSHFGRSRSSLLLKSKRASSDGLPEYPGNKVLGLARSGQASRPTSPCPDTVNPLAGGSRSPPPLSLPEGPGYGYAQTCEARMGGGQPVPMTQLFTAPLYARLPAPVHPGMMYYSDPNSIPPEMGYLVNGQYHRDAMPIRTVSYPAVLESLQRQASISGNTVMGIPRHFGAGASSDNRDTYEGEMRMHPTQPCGIGNSSGDTLPQTVPTTLNANGEAPLEQNTSTAETLSRVSEQLRRQTMSPVLEDNCIRPSSKRGSSGPDKTSNSDTEFSPDKQHANRSTVSGTSRPLFPMPHPMERRASEIRFSGMVYKRPTGEGAEQGDERGPLEGSRPTSPDPWRSEGIEVIHEEGTRFPTDGQLLDKVRQIVESGNIMILTKRDVRDHLSEHFGVDVTPKRHLVNNYIDELLSSMVENHQDSR